MARICIIRHHYYPQETHVRRNAEALVERGHEVDLICLRDAGQAPIDSIGGVNVHRLRVQHHRRGIGRYLLEYSAFFLLTLITLTGRQLRRRYDVVEVDTMPDFLVFSTIPAKMLGAKVVLYLFDAMPEVFADKYGLPATHWMIRSMGLIERIAVRYADRVITACEALRATFVARGAPREKITIVLNVPNERVFRPELARPRRERRESSPFTIITHGTLTKLYGIQVVLKAVARLKEQLPGLRYLVVGAGEYGATLKELSKELRLEQVVSFIDWVPQERIVELILDADAGIVPVLGGYGELTTPNKLFEYIALGRPVISTSLRGIRDYFDDDSLLFYPPEDDVALSRHIGELYHNPLLADALTSKAHAIYEPLRWQRSKEIYCDVFDFTPRATSCRRAPR
jgi:glycosyltransferase involved in cell wall biosynthesis